MKNEIESAWAKEEFSDVDLGDKRRNKRLVHLCGRLSKALSLERFPERVNVDDGFVVVSTASSSKVSLAASTIR